MGKVKKNVVLVRDEAEGGNLDLVKKISEKVLEEMGFRNVELSVVFVDSLRAKNLNKKYRKMDYVPQVLGFPMSREIDKDGLVRLGDVVICVEELNKETEKYGKKRKEILREWIRHGIKNLLK